MQKRNLDSYDLDNILSSVNIINCQAIVYRVVTM